MEEFMQKTACGLIWGIFLILVLAGPMSAQPPAADDDEADFDDRDNYSYSRPELTPEQSQTWDKLWTAYQDKIYPLRSQLADQRLLYQLLADQNTVNIEEAKKVIAEMRKLSDQIRTESQKFIADLKTSGLPEILGIHARGRHGGFGFYGACPGPGGLFGGHHGLKGGRQGYRGYPGHHGYKGYRGYGDDGYYDGHRNDQRYDDNDYYGPRHGYRGERGDGPGWGRPHRRGR
jgi:hypothetical protein